MRLVCCLTAELRCYESEDETTIGLFPFQIDSIVYICEKVYSLDRRVGGQLGNLSFCAFRHFARRDKLKTDQMTQTARWILRDCVSRIYHHVTLSFPSLCLLVSLEKKGIFCTNCDARHIISIHLPFVCYFEALNSEFEQMVRIALITNICWNV